MEDNFLHGAKIREVLSISLRAQSPWTAGEDDSAAAAAAAARAAAKSAAGEMEWSAIWIR